MLLARILVCIAIILVGISIVAIGVAIARDYRHIASNRYESFWTHDPLGWLSGRKRDLIDFASYKRYVSLPWMFFGAAAVALGIDGLAHL
jgi:hypothetical protein